MKMIYIALVFASFFSKAQAAPNANTCNNAANTSNIQMLLGASDYVNFTKESTNVVFSIVDDIVELPLASLINGRALPNELESAMPAPTITLSPTNGTCTANGSITVTATGATGTVLYAVKKSTDAGYSTPQSENEFKNLASGTYTVAVYDEAVPGGTISNPVIITNPVYVPMTVLGTATPGNSVVTACDPDGSIDLSLTAGTGTPPFTYQLKGGPTSKPNVTGPVSGTAVRNVKFTQLETGIYSIDITDACGFQISANNISVVSKYNLANVDLGSFELNGAIFKSNDGCDLSVKFSTNNTLLKDVSSNVLFQRDVKHIPKDFPIEMRVEYPAGSKNYTPWASIFGFFDIAGADYIPTLNTYRIQVRNPCNNSDTVTSPVYTIPYPIASRGGYCASAVFRSISGYNCGQVSIRVKHATKSDTKTFTWDDAATSFALDFSGLSTGDYNVFIIVEGVEYQTTKVNTKPTNVDIGVDLYNYYSTSDCDFFTGNIRSYKVPADNTIPITYTMLSGPVAREPVTSTQNLSPIWSNVPNGMYQIKVNYGDCREDIQIRTMDNPFGGFGAAEVSYIPGSSCRKYQITGKGWYLAPDSAVSTKTTDYVVRVLDVSGNPIPGSVTKDRVTVSNNAPFVISTWEVDPGTYKVIFASGLGTGYKCNYIEKYVTIPPSTALSIDVSTSGGVVCAGGYGELHVGTSGGSGQRIMYQIKPQAAPVGDYTSYQASPDFPNLLPGSYTVQAKDSTCGSATQDLTLVSGTAVSRVDVLGSTCEGSRAILNLHVIGKVTDIKWTHPNGAEFHRPADTIRNLSLSDAGKYMVEFTLGGCTWKDSVTLSINPKPNFVFTPTTIACQAVDLTALALTAGDTTGVSRTYNNSTYQPLPMPTSVGAGTYRIVGVNAFGCSDTSTVSVTIHPTSTEADITANPVTVCSGTAAVLNAQTIAPGIINPVFRWYASQTIDTVLGTGANYALPATTVATTTTYTYYISVSGDNYCENLPNTRKAVTFTVNQIPTVKIQTSEDTLAFCHNNNLVMQAVVTAGTPIWYGWEDSHGSTATSQYSPASTGVDIANVTYNPDLSEAGKTIKLRVRVRDAVCLYVADSIYINVLAAPDTVGFSIVTQPQAFQEMCTDTIYELKVKSVKAGDLKNLTIRLDDYKATEIAIKGASIKQPYTTGIWEDLTNSTSDLTGTTWALPDTLLQGDSLLVRVTVAAECGFYSGSGVQFMLNATSLCGDIIPEQMLTTAVFNTKQDTAQLNTYQISGLFSHNTVSNNTNDTVTWRIKAIVQGIQPTDSTKENVMVLIPAGLTVIPNSYLPLRNAPNRTSLKFNLNAFGLECIIPVKSGVMAGDSIIAELKFHATGAPCGDYNFSSEIVFADSVTCGGDKCSFFSMRGGAYPTLAVERYEFSLANVVYGETVDNKWYGNIEVKAETEFFAGDSIYIDFYVDRDGNMAPSPADTLVRKFTHITSAIPNQGVFTVNFDSVHVELRKQLLAVVGGKALCKTSVLPIATLMGADTVCQADTALYYTVPGMQAYKWKVINPVDAVSGATPVRIPLEGSTSDTYATEHVARVVWKKQGDYIVWAQYSLPTNPPHEIGKTYFPVRVNQRPVVALTGAPDTTICEGMRVELNRFIRDTTGVGTLSFYKKEKNGTYTFLSNTSPFIVSPTDTTVYRATATADESGCASLNAVEFRVNVHKMPHVGSISVGKQPTCETATGNIKIAVSGGSGSYAYSLNNIAGAYSNLPANGTIANLPTGNYSIYVKDNVQNACPVSISEPVSLQPANSGLYAEAKTTVAGNCGQANGSIQLVVNGGKPNYRYKINNGTYASLPANGLIGANFAAGAYNITVMDSTGCTTTPGQVVVVANSDLVLTLSQVSPATCNTAGLVSIKISEGAKPYQYRLRGKGWVTMHDSTETIRMSAGLYQLFVKDAAGCETSDTIRVANTSDVFISLAEKFNALCDGVGNGSARVNIRGSVQPLYYSINEGKNTYGTTTGLVTIPGLSVGSYTITLTDGNGCTSTLEDVEIGRDFDFIEAVNDRVYTHVNKTVSGYLMYDEYERNRYDVVMAGNSLPLHGAVTITESGRFTYTPDVDFIGTDSLRYTIENACRLRSAAWLHIHVLDVSTVVNRAPIAMDNDYSVQAGMSFHFDVRKNDTDPDGDALSKPVVLSNVHRGTIVQNADSTFTYTSDINFVGVDVLTYRVCDPLNACSEAQVHLSVLPNTIFNNYIIALPDAYNVAKYDTLNVANPLNGILANDTYPSGATPAIGLIDSTGKGQLTLNTTDGTFTYIPQPHYAGPDAFSYLLCANVAADCDTAWVHIFVADRPCPSPVTLVLRDTLTVCQGDSVDLRTAILPASLNVDTVAFYTDREHQTEISSPYANAQGYYYIKADNPYGCSAYDSAYVQVIPPATLTLASRSVSLCAGSTIRIAVDTTHATSILWSGYSATGMATATTTDTLRYTANLRTNDTTFYLYATAQGAGPCGTLTDSVAVTVRAQPAAPAVTTPVVYCQGAIAVPLTATATGGNTLNWYNATDASISVPTPLTAMVDTTAYRVSQSQGGCEGPAAEILVMVKATPSATINQVNPILCAGNMLILTATTNDTQVKWESTNPSVASINATTGAAMSLSAGTTVIQYIVNNSNSCTDTAKTTLTVAARPVAAPITGVDKVCKDMTTQLNNVTAGGIWKSLNENIAVVNNSGLLSAVDTGSVTIRYIVSNANSCMDSTSISITVIAKTEITIQPIGGSICTGGSYTFGVHANGVNLSYQWQKQTSSNTWTNIASAASTYTVSNAEASDSGNYRVLVISTCGTDSSALVALFVDITPSIANHPAGGAICVGESYTFRVAATGTNINYQWQKEEMNGAWATVPGATADSCIINNATMADGGNYRVLVNGSCESLTSNVAALTVNTTTGIITQPANARISIGGSYTFYVSAIGGGLSYQWQHYDGSDWNDITGATGASYTCPYSTKEGSENYRVLISGACGSAMSEEAVLTISSCLDITIFQWDDIPTVNCNMATNGGYNFVSFQWYKNGVIISGATKAYYKIPQDEFGDGHTYYCSLKTEIGETMQTCPFQSILPCLNEIIFQWPDMLSMNSNLATNGGHTFKAYQWYKDDALITGATAASYQVPEKELGKKYHYYCIVTTKEEETLQTCSFSIPSTTLADKPYEVYPNPVGRGQLLTVQRGGNNLSGELEIDIYDLTGELRKQYRSSLPLIKIEAPLNQGYYIVQLKTKAGVVYTTKILVQ